MMALKGLHILLTYICNYECDHCFVWGSPWQSGTFTLAQLDDVLEQAVEAGGIKQIYFEGGEAFLYYPILVEAVGRAKKLGFWTGIVTNGYWATGMEDAWMWLKPLAEAGLDALEVSADIFHGQDGEEVKELASLVAAGELFLDASTIVIEPPGEARVPDQAIPGQPLVGGDVMYRGRAAEKLAGGLPGQRWTLFDSCPYENLADPGRIHLDPLGNLHVCQGIVIGNLFEQPLKQILAEYDHATHPVIGPLLDGGPANLVNYHSLTVESEYVDACHLCYSARVLLRPTLTAGLGPDQMYGVFGE
jgi:MoaA/NifB/PqqE/SkfB family radical SAM enzyme